MWKWLKYNWILFFINAKFPIVEDISELSDFTIEQLEDIRKRQYDVFFEDLNKEFPELFEKIIASAYKKIPSESDFNKLIFWMIDQEILKINHTNEKVEYRSFKNEKYQIEIRVSLRDNTYFEIYYKNSKVFSNLIFERIYYPGEHFWAICKMIKDYTVSTALKENEAKKGQRAKLINQIIKQDNPFEE